MIPPRTVSRSAPVRPVEPRADARAREVETWAARAALARDNVRAAYLYALADALRRGLPNPERLAR